jgi:hypothetical protein
MTLVVGGLQRTGVGVIYLCIAVLLAIGLGLGSVRISILRRIAWNRIVMIGIISKCRTGSVHFLVVGEMT